MADSLLPQGGSAHRLDWLGAEIDRQLAGYRRRRRRDKRKAFALQMATVTLSGAITVLLGLRVTGVAERRLDDIALTMGALITVLAAAEAFFTHRGLWILRTVTVHRLETLRRRVEYYRSGLGESDPTGAAVDGHFAELDRILAQDEVAWQQLRAPSLGPLHPDVDREGTAA